MKNKTLIIVSFIFTASALFGDSIVREDRHKPAWIIKDGRIYDARETATLPPQEHYEKGYQALLDEDWNEASGHFLVLSKNFPDSPYGADASYYLGVSYYHLKEYDFANDAFSSYLNSGATPKYYEEAILYKFYVAEWFRHGAKRHPFSTQRLPKWADAYEQALEIYDEVIMALPTHDLAAQALYSKARLHRWLKEYKEAVDCFQALIRRFPKHEHTPEAYLRIGKIYLDRSKYEYQNPDILEFAKINLRKFKTDFPREERLAEAEADVMRLKELYANGLYQIGKFYEKTSRPGASVIYYYRTVKKFPETHVAGLCRRRLSALSPELLACMESEE